MNSPGMGIRRPRVRQAAAGEAWAAGKAGAAVRQAAVGEAWAAGKAGGATDRSWGADKAAFGG
jgi:hypothetical protein